jgi:hypothetical protein
MKPVDIEIDRSKCVGRPPCVENAVVGRHQEGREGRIREMGEKEAMGGDGAWAAVTQPNMKARVLDLQLSKSREEGEISCSKFCDRTEIDDVASPSHSDMKLSAKSMPSTNTASTRISMRITTRPESCLRSNYQVLFLANPTS